jgi:hypothetical protein
VLRLSIAQKLACQTKKKKCHEHPLFCDGAISNQGISPHPACKGRGRESLGGFRTFFLNRLTKTQTQTPVDLDDFDFCVAGPYCPHPKFLPKPHLTGDPQPGHTSFHGQHKHGEP